MRSWFAGVAVLLGACLAPQPPDGSVICASSGQQCPDGYHCEASSNTCWKDGRSPDMATSTGGEPDLATTDLAVNTKHKGEACGAADVCDTGHCVDNYCCDTDCSSTCMACNLMGLIGTCSPVVAGNDPSHGTCMVQDPSTCGTDGKCDGSGACRKYPSGTQCSTASCDPSSNMFSPASQCDGSGKCIANNGYDCQPFKCNGT